MRSNMLNPTFTSSCYQCTYVKVMFIRYIQEYLKLGSVTWCAFFTEIPIYSSPQKKFPFSKIERERSKNGPFLFHSVPLCSVIHVQRLCKTQLGQRCLIYFKRRARASFHSHGMLPSAVAIRLVCEFEKSIREIESLRALSI